MRRATAAWWLWLTLTGCPNGAGRAAVDEGEPVVALPVTSVGVPFQVKGRPCVVQSAEQRFGEYRRAPAGRPAPDVRALRVLLHCGTDPERHQPPEGLLLRLHAGGSEGVAPSDATTINAAARPGVHVFVLPRGAPFRGRGRLQVHVRGSGAEVVVRWQPRAPEHDPTVELSACDQQRQAMERRASEAFRKRPGHGTCNMLGLLLPGPCKDVDRELRRDALDHGARCAPAIARPTTARVPEDLHITLRRGRTTRALDRNARYTVSVFHNGFVVFHGKHWVRDVGRSDGRTAQSLLSGLWQRVQAMSYFDRRGQWPDPETDCEPSGDRQGNLITVRGRGRERMVVDRKDCRGPFEAKELSDLARHIEAVASVTTWTSPRPGYADPGAQVWTVPVD